VEKLTSDKLEGLGYELVTVLPVFVVRHICGSLSSGSRGGVAAMAGGRRRRGGDGSEVEVS
jgi:hypothetical protein